MIYVAGFLLIMMTFQFLIVKLMLVSFLERNINFLNSHPVVIVEFWFSIFQE